MWWTVIVHNVWKHMEIILPTQRVLKAKLHLLIKKLWNGTNHLFLQKEASVLAVVLVFFTRLVDAQNVFFVAMLYLIHLSYHDSSLNSHAKPGINQNSFPRAATLLVFIKTWMFAPIPSSLESITNLFLRQLYFNIFTHCQWQISQFKKFWHMWSGDHYPSRHRPFK